MDTQIKIWAPPDANAVANLDELGGVDLSADNWTLIGLDWISFNVTGASNSPIGGQSQEVQTVTIEMWRRSDLELDHRLEILNGPYAGRFLYVDSIPFTDSRAKTVNVLCSVAGRTR